MPKLTAYNLRFANRLVSIGNSSFPFNKDGYMEVEDTGYTWYDYKHLMDMQGMAEKPPMPPVVIPLTPQAAELLKEVEKEPIMVEEPVVSPVVAIAVGVKPTLELISDVTLTSAIVESVDQASEGIVPKPKKAKKKE